MYFVGGILAAGVFCLIALRMNDLVVLSQDELDAQAQQIVDLQEENLELTNDLFDFQGPDAIFDSTDLPYDETADAQTIVDDARTQALQAGNFLMITFGANWCMDCRTLYQSLKSDDVSAYTDGLFSFAHVDVGRRDKNREVAEELGVDLARGIPVAIFFDPAGNVIGTTNDGQLDPARYYSSKQILKFVRDIAERSLISAPDSVE